ncbi:hypothetical protein O181_075088 [Austropuccinia psidii MF-1]|uniref:Uncharacterized protein n=1 Tax=Austropuccinia psidii MF-1 TaxID=1389203 RepID=A0A9Q3IBJ3_9BASI|nr:hypothetical protein [Austropuccinia psidii MF-1]
MDLRNVLNYHDEISYWQLPKPEEDPDYLIITYIELKEIYYEAPIKEKGKKYLSNLPGLNISSLEFKDILIAEGLRRNIANKYWDEIFSFDKKTRKSLYDSRVWPKEYFKLHNMELPGGRITWE